MPYLGNPPAEAYSSVTKDSFSGDGSTTAFTLSVPSTTNNMRVVVENVIQDPTVAYTVSGTTLTFTSAPPTGTNNIYAVNLGPAVQTTEPPSTIANATTFSSNLTVQGDLTVDTNTLFVDSTNNLVGVGTTSPSSFNAGANNLVVGTGSGSEGITIYADNSSNSAIFFADTDSTTTGQLNYQHASNVMTFHTNGGTERLRIQSGGGISFNGDTAAANALDDYEEGTYTPVFSAGPSSVTYSVQVGTYTKVGNLVLVAFAITMSAFSGTASHAQISLPFTSANTGNLYHPSCLQVDNLTGDNRQVGIQINPNNNNAILIRDIGTTGAHDGLNSNRITTSSSIRGTAIYRTA